MTHLKQANLHCIDQLQWLIRELKPEQYSSPLKIFHQVSIGKHLRHIIEFYQGLIQASDELNYDLRKRDQQLETDPKLALKDLDEIREFIQKVESDYPLHLKANYGLQDDGDEVIQTSFCRELAYNLEHCVHHMAIIRIGVESFEPEFSFPPDFGIARSTLRSQENNSLSQSAY